MRAALCFAECPWTMFFRLARRSVWLAAWPALRPRCGARGCRELRRWVDPAAEAKHALLHARREARAGRLAGALKALDKAANGDDKNGKDALECARLRARLYERLGWAHWARQETSRNKSAFPPAYPLF